MRITVTKDNEVFPFNMKLDPYASTIPYFSEIAESTQEIPGLDGEIQTNSRYAAKSHVLVMKSEINTFRDDKSALRFKVNDYLLQIKDVDGILHYEKLESIFHVRAVGMAEITSEYAGWIEFHLSLKSHDPCRYRDKETKIISAGVAANKGNKETPVRFEFDGAAINPYVIINGVRYQYNGTISDGNTLIVDSSDYTAKIVNKSTGSETLVNSLWNGNFLLLPRGDSLVNDISKEDGSARVIWRDRWV